MQVAIPQGAEKMYHIPRQEGHTVIQHNIQVRRGDEGYAPGVLFQGDSSGMTFARAYCDFKCADWIFEIGDTNA